MHLLGSPASPFVRKARVVMAEAGIDDIPFVEVTASPLGGDDGLNAANPLGKIPALSREDGPTLYDSRVVTRFLDARYNAGLYPATRLWETLTLEATADGIMDAAVAITYEKRHRPEEMWFAPWLDGQWSKIARSLDAIERQWMSHLTGPLDMGQIAVGCALAYLDFRHGDRDWRADHPALAAWFATFADRPSMVATAP
ncbi:Glutathione S-transferase family protein [Roseibacterium elongatum DSM 19469]|uniref:Glutathione S-transferase family protein n=1 Tax=Roseicyclus elongatus DSM 19469 TaxID=1294273 RepID=W8RQF3_9RHOB|nr:glutathione S-transferase [Roseibacterium elongatum]AHM03298.1 Glutathione S-transferase family protein [Roseibacterium elongatum DSM 19469]